MIDAVNDSGGGIAHSLEAAMNRFLWTQQLGQTSDGSQLIGVSKQYFWYQIAKDAVANLSISNSSIKNPSIKSASTEQKIGPFSALAANLWIQYLTANSDKTELDQLDLIHAVAKQDRFDREVETGEETLESPADAFAVPGVPEPEEWALLIMVGGLLLLSYIRQRRTLPLNNLA